jgi:hypothetical protein
VTSTVSPSERESTTSIAVTAPPADPTAVAMRPIDAGSPSAVSRTVIEYEAEVTGPRGTAPAVVAGSLMTVSAAPTGADWVLMAFVIVPPEDVARTIVLA